LNSFRYFCRGTFETFAVSCLSAGAMATSGDDFPTDGAVKGVAFAKRAACDFFSAQAFLDAWRMPAVDFINSGCFSLYCGLPFVLQPAVHCRRLRRCYRRNRRRDR